MHKNKRDYINYINYINYIKNYINYNKKNIRGETFLESDERDLW